ncbi:MAG: acyltransferase family protein [Mucilaginibacter sp.]
MSERKHLYQVDYIRAFASLSVAVFHLGGKVLPVLKYGWLGVEMFFVLSGFIICKAMPPNYSLKMGGRFITKRIVRIEPPYIISLILLLTLNFLIGHGYHPGWDNVLLHIGYLNNLFNTPYLNPVYWTLGIEFQYYIFIALLFPLVINRYGKWLIILLSILPLFIPIPAQVLWNFFPLFAIGISCFLFASNKINKALFAIFFISTTICSFWLLGWLETAVGVLTAGVLLMPLKYNRIVSFLSDISFSLYLTHDIVGSRLVVYVGTLLPKTYLYKGAIFIAGVGVSILIAWIFYRLIEKPFFDKSKSIRYAPVCDVKSELLV